eukprot:392239_1
MIPIELRRSTIMDGLYSRFFFVETYYSFRMLFALRLIWTLLHYFDIIRRHFIVWLACSKPYYPSTHHGIHRAKLVKISVFTRSMIYCIFNKQANCYLITTMPFIWLFDDMG